jgi:hypothetical protein
MPGKDLAAAAAAGRDAKAEFEAQRKEVLDKLQKTTKKCSVRWALLDGEMLCFLL